MNDAPAPEHAIAAGHSSAFAPSCSGGIFTYRPFAAKTVDEAAVETGMSDDMWVHRRAGLIEAEVDGEIVALHIDNGTCYGFNATATRIWTMIVEPRPISDLRDALVAMFDVEATTCAQELDALLGELEKDGLIELRPGRG